VLPNAIVLNSLYATNVLAIQAMAEHIIDVLRAESDTPSIDVVQKIARLRGLGPARDKSRRFLSFASKYCHFFIDCERFPILDEFAGRALTYHLGRCGRSHYRRSPFNYETYVADVDRLRTAAHLECSYPALDRYLWLRGQWLEYQKRKKSDERGPVKEEVWNLFKQPRDACARRLIAQAFGECSA